MEPTLKDIFEYEDRLIKRLVAFGEGRKAQQVKYDELSGDIISPREAEEVDESIKTKE